MILRGRRHVILAVGALIFATGLVAVAMLAVALNLRLLSDSFDWVRHTDEVLLQVAGIEVNLVTAESAERGYLLPQMPSTRETSWTTGQGSPVNLRP